MSSRSRLLPLLIFLAVCILSLGAGMLQERSGRPLELSCGGGWAQSLPGPPPDTWVLHRSNLNLRADGLGDYKARLRLLDTTSGQDLGYRHRTVNFSYRLQGQNLLLRVLHSADSRTSNLEPDRLAAVGLYIFTEGMQLTYRLRWITQDTLLIEDGQGGVFFCARNPL